MSKNIPTRSLWYGSKIRDKSSPQKFKIEKKFKGEFNFLDRGKSEIAFDRGKIEFNTFSIDVDSVHDYNHIIHDELGNIEDAEFSVKEVDLHYDDRRFKQRGKVFRFAPYGLRFTKPAKVTIPYECDPSEEDSLQVYTYDQSTDEWEITRKLDQDKDNKTITFEAYHFSDYTPGQGSYKVDESGTFDHIDFSGEVDTNFGAVLLSRSDASISTRSIPVSISSRFNSDYLYSTIIPQVGEFESSVSGTNTLPDMTNNYYRLANGWTWSLPFINAFHRDSFKISLGGGKQYNLKSLMTDALFGVPTLTDDMYSVEGFQFNYHDVSADRRKLTALIVEELTTVEAEVDRIFDSNQNRYHYQVDMSTVVITTGKGKTLRFTSNGYISQMTDMKQLNNVHYSYETEALTGTVSSNSTTMNEIELEASDYNDAKVGDIITIRGVSKTIFEKLSGNIVKISGEFLFTPTTDDQYHIGVGKLNKVYHAEDGRAIKIFYYTGSDSHQRMMTVLSSDYTNTDEIISGDSFLAKYTFDGDSRSSNLVKYEVLDYTAQTNDTSFSSTLNTDDSLYSSSLQEVNYEYSLSTDVTDDYIRVTNKAGAYKQYTFKESCHESHMVVDTSSASFITGKLVEGSGVASTIQDQPGYILNITEPQRSDGTAVSLQKGNLITIPINYNGARQTYKIDYVSEDQKTLVVRGLQGVNDFPLAGQDYTIDIITGVVDSQNSGNHLPDVDQAYANNTIVTLDRDLSADGISIIPYQDRIKITDTYDKKEYDLLITEQLDSVDGRTRVATEMLTDKNINQSFFAYVNGTRKIDSITSNSKARYPYRDVYGIGFTSDSRKIELINKVDDFLVNADPAELDKISLKIQSDTLYRFSKIDSFSKEVEWPDPGWDWGWGGKPDNVDDDQDEIVTFENIELEEDEGFYPHKSRFVIDIPGLRDAYSGSILRIPVENDGSDHKDKIRIAQLAHTINTYDQSDWDEPGDEIEFHDVPTTDSTYSIMSKTTSSNGNVVVTLNKQLYNTGGQNVVEPLRYTYEIYKPGQYAVNYLNKPKVDTVRTYSSSTSSDFKEIKYTYSYGVGKPYFEETDDQIMPPGVQPQLQDVRLYNTEKLHQWYDSNQTKYIAYTRVKSGFSYNSTSDEIRRESVFSEKFNQTSQSWKVHKETIKHFSPVSYAFPQIEKPTSTAVKRADENGVLQSIPAITHYTQYDTIGRMIKTWDDVRSPGGYAASYVKYINDKNNQMGDRGSKFTEDDYEADNNTVFDATKAYGLVSAKSSDYRDVPSGTSDSRQKRVFTRYSDGVEKPLGVVDQVRHFEQSMLTNDELTDLGINGLYVFSGGDSREKIKQFLYDNITGNMTGVILPSGDQIDIEYGSSPGWKASYVVHDAVEFDNNINGNTQYVVNEFDYDIRGRLISESTKFTTDQLGTTLVDSNKYPTVSFTYSYDGMNRLLTKQNGQGTYLVVNQFDDAARESVSTNSLGMRTKAYVDELYRPYRSQTFKPNVKADAQFNVVGSVPPYNSTVVATNGGPTYRFKWSGVDTSEGGMSPESGSTAGYTTTIISNDSGQCGQFNSTDLVYPNQNDVNGSDTTRKIISVWIQPTVDTTTGRHSLYEEGGGTNWWHLYIDNGTFYSNVGESHSSTGYVTSTTTIQQGNTYHLVCEVDAPNDVLNLYVNGELESTSTAGLGSSFDSHIGDWTFGGNYDAKDHNSNQVNSSFTGYMADFCYWAEPGRLLTSLEVDQLYASGVGLPGTAQEVLVGAAEKEYHPFYGKVERSYTYTDVTKAQSWDHSGTGVIMKERLFDEIGRTTDVYLTAKDGTTKKHVSQKIYHDIDNAITSKVFTDAAFAGSESNAVWNESYTLKDWAGRGPVQKISYAEKVTGDGTTYSSVTYDSPGTHTPRTTTLTYDVLGNVEVRQQPDNEEFQFFYSTDGAQEKMLYPDGTYTLSGYNDNGNIISAIDRRGRKTEFTYNVSNKPVRAFTAGLAIPENDWQGVDVEVNSKYSHLGICYTETKEDTTIVASYDTEYDITGKPNKITQSIDGMPQDRVIDQSFDAAGNITHQTVSGTAEGWSKTIQMRPLYYPGGIDESHQMISAILKQDNTPIVTVYTSFDGTNEKIVYGPDETKNSEFTYDDFLRLETITNTFDTSTNRTYTRNFIGNITQMDGKHYGYDGFERLDFSDADDDQGTNGISYAYDPIGNLTQKDDATYEYEDESDPEFGDSANTMHLHRYQDPDQSIDWTFEYDNSGNVTKVEGRFFELRYDNLNQLREIFYKEMDEVVDRKRDRYWYDNNGLRVKKEKSEEPVSVIGLNGSNDMTVTSNSGDMYVTKLSTETPQVAEYNTIHYTPVYTEYVMYKGNDVLIRETFDDQGTLVEYEYNIVSSGTNLATFRGIQ